MRRLLAIVALALACAYAGVLALLYVKQRDLLYPRNPARADVSAANLPGVEEVRLATADGETLIVWVVPPREGKPVLLFFHGNGGNFGRGRQARFRALTEDGTGLVAVNYRGYGGSTGTPSEAGLEQDALAAYDAAVARFGAGRLVGYGESLGTGVVLKLAASKPLKAVILEAPYMSTAAVAQQVYPYVPVGLLMLDQFRSDLVIGELRVPLLFLHGVRDTVVPYGQGEALFALANAPKRFVRFPEGNHGNLLSQGVVQEMRRFLADRAAGTLAPSEMVVTMQDAPRP